MRALIKEALISDNVLLYIWEGQSDVNGFGKVRLERVKGIVEYGIGRNEVQIRERVPVDS